MCITLKKNTLKKFNKNPLFAGETNNSTEGLLLF